MGKRTRIIALTACVAVILTGCNLAVQPGVQPADNEPPKADLGLNTETKEATQYTIDANDQVYALLDFNDERELANAQKGLIAAPDKLEIKTDTGKVAWSQSAYAFLEKDAPHTANPSLWRNAQLNHIYGLFEVVDGIYQVRGYDMSNITFIKGDTGWIVYDPLMTVECEYITAFTG